jgi:hypothetical protein
MYTNNMFAKRFANIIAAAGLIASSMLPAALLTGTAQAAQITSRSIDMSKGAAGATSTTYTVTFSNATGGTVQGIVVDFCTTALIGTSCTAPNGLSLTAVTPQTIDSASFTQTISSNKLTMTNATGSTASAAESYSFTVTATNPSTVGTFYARIATYATEAAANAYTSTSPGSYVDYGSVAMSTTNDITVTGIVTESLSFCVGSAPANATASTSAIQNCAASGFSSAATVGIGVIGSTLTETPNSTDNGGTNTDGAFLIKTNAIGGATVGYKANQNTSSGKLKVDGANCSGTSITDACINSAGTTATTLSGEGFGMAVSTILYPDSKTGSGTTNLVRDADYSYSGSNTFAWDDTGTYDLVASSTGSATKVMDYEVGILRFGALIAPTTPSGLYTVSANFVATGTF